MKSVVTIDRVYRIHISYGRFGRGENGAQKKLWRHYAVFVFPGAVFKRLAIGNDMYKLLVAAGVPAGKR